MKKLNKKMNELIEFHQNNELKEFIDTLNPQEVGNFLHVVKIKKREVISKNFNKVRKIEEKIAETEEDLTKQNGNGNLNLQLSFLKDDIIEIEKRRDEEIKCMEKIQEILSKKKEDYQKERKKRIKSKTQ